MQTDRIPKTIPNWINGEQSAAASGTTFAKLSPHNGQEICQVTRSATEDVEQAVEAAKNEQVLDNAVTHLQQLDEAGMEFVYKTPNPRGPG